MHAIYIAHYSQNNLVEKNYVGHCSGDPFRIRDNSNNNTFNDNYAYRSGRSGFISEWFRDNTESESTQIYINNNTFTFCHPDKDIDNPTLYTYSFNNDGGNIVPNYYTGSNNFTIGTPPACEEVATIVSFDINGDGIEELFTGINYEDFSIVLKSTSRFYPYLNKVLFVSTNWEVGALDANKYGNESFKKIIIGLNDRNGNGTKIYKGDGINSILNYGLIFSNDWWKVKAMTSGDYDGDGKNEIFVAFNDDYDSNSYNTQIFKGDGLASVSNLGMFYSNSYWFTAAMTSGDYNGDGKDEVITAFNAPGNYTGDKTQIFKGNGTYSLTTQGKIHSSTYWETASMVSIDTNNDGKDEVFTSFYIPFYNVLRAVQIFKGNGNNSITGDGKVFEDDTGGAIALLSSENTNNSTAINMFLTRQASSHFYRFAGNNWQIYLEKEFYLNSNLENCYSNQQRIINKAQQDNSSFRIYPNPSTDKINIELIDTQNIGSYRYEVFDVNGNKLKDGRFSGNKEEVDVLSINKGIYFVKVYNGENVSTKSFVKE